MLQSSIPILKFLGAAAAGLVWGWLVGLLAGRVRRKLLTPLLVFLATIPVAIEIWWYLGPASLVWAGVAGALSFFLHVAWRSHLRSQANLIHPDTGGGS
jgi:NhaP-type Na+/H+ or K+/H+ antiporter